MEENEPNTVLNYFQQAKRAVSSSDFEHFRRRHNDITGVSGNDPNESDVSIKISQYQSCLLVN